jgi:hypothetical protein
MRIYDYNVSLEHFEALLLSGEMVQRSAVRHNHAASMVQLSLHDAEGNSTVALQPPVRLQPGEQLHRTLECEKVGQYPRFGLDHFMHDEFSMKDVDGSLRVHDVLSFHDGASTAQRGYTARPTPYGMQREVDDWQVNMAGLVGPQARMRPLIEAGMRHTLPKTDIEMQSILEEESLRLQDAA